MSLNDSLPTSELLAYARRRIAESGLSGAIHAGVFIQVSQDGPMQEIQTDHPFWFSVAGDGQTRVEANAVTIADEFVWFDCRKPVEVDRAIDLFVRSVRPNQQAKGAA